MPLTQPRRNNLLMRRYFDALGMTGKELARRAGVSHSQVYMARQRNVGARNATKIARAVASLLELSADEELELKAEIMGDPENLIHAYLGNAQEIAETLNEEPSVGWDLIGGKPLSYKAGNRVLKQLQAMEAPEAILCRVRDKIKPPPSPPGRITYTLSGEAVRQQRDKTQRTLEAAKPSTHRAIAASGLSRKEIYERAQVGRETLRKALYEYCGKRNAAAVSEVLAQASNLPEHEREAVRNELLHAPEEILKDSQKNSSKTR